MLITLLLVIPLAFYLLVYGSSRQEYYQRHYSIELAGVARSLSQNVNNIPAVLQLFFDEDIDPRLLADLKNARRTKSDFDELLATHRRNEEQRTALEAQRAEVSERLAELEVRIQEQAYRRRQDTVLFGNDREDAVRRSFAELDEALQTRLETVTTQLEQAHRLAERMGEARAEWVRADLCLTHAQDRSRAAFEFRRGKHCLFKEGAEKHLEDYRKHLAHRLEQIDRQTARAMDLAPIFDRMTMRIEPFTPSGICPAYPTYRVKHGAAGKELAIRLCPRRELQGLSAGLAMEASFPIDSLLTADGSAPGIDAIVLTDAAGRVLGQRSTALGPVTHSEQLLELSDEPEANGAAASQVQALSSLLPRGEAESTIALQGRTFRSFHQEVPIALAPAPGAAVAAGDWQVVGLVNAATLSRQSREIPLPVVSVALALLLLLVAGLPLVKLWLLNPTQGMGKLSLAAMCAGAALFVTLIMVAIAHVSVVGIMARTLDEALQATGTELDTDFARELQQTLLALEEQSAHMVGLSDAEPDPPNGRTGAAHALEPLGGPLTAAVQAAFTKVERKTETDGGAPAGGSACQPQQLPLSRQTTCDAVLAAGAIEGPPPFETVLWLDLWGRPLANPGASTTDGCAAEGPPHLVATHMCRRPTEPPVLEHRAYVQRVRSGDLFVLPGDQRVPSSNETSTDCAGCPIRRYYIDRILSLRDGMKQTAISAPLRIAYADEPAEAGEQPAKHETTLVQVVLRRFGSLTAATLGPGMGFAVVEPETGRVLYHSDDSLSLVENFYSEIRNDRSLRGLIEERRADFVSHTYHGKDHRLYVRPLGQTPWSLVLFANVTYRQAMSFEVLIVTVVHLALLALFLMALLALVGSFSKKARWSWLWPTSANARTYPIASLFVLSALVFAYGLTVAGGLVFGPFWMGSAMALQSEHFLAAELALPVLLGSALRLALGPPDRPWVSTGCWFAVVVSLLVLLWCTAVSGDGAAGVLFTGLLFATARLLLMPRATPGNLSERLWHLNYSVVLTVGLLVVAVVPGLSIYQDAVSFQLERADLFSRTAIEREVEDRATDYLHYARRFAEPGVYSIGDWLTWQAEQRGLGAAAPAADGACGALALPAGRTLLGDEALVDLCDGRLDESPPPPGWMWDVAGRHRTALLTGLIAPFSEPSERLAAHSAGWDPPRQVADSAGAVLARGEGTPANPSRVIHARRAGGETLDRLETPSFLGKAYRVVAIAAPFLFIPLLAGVYWFAARIFALRVPEAFDRTERLSGPPGSWLLVGGKVWRRQPLLDRLDRDGECNEISLLDKARGVPKTPAQLMDQLDPAHINVLTEVDEVLRDADGRASLHEILTGLEDWRSRSVLVPDARGVVVLVCQRHPLTVLRAALGHHRTTEPHDDPDRWHSLLEALHVSRLPSVYRLLIRPSAFGLEREIYLLERDGLGRREVLELDPSVPIEAGLALDSRVRLIVVSALDAWMLDRERAEALVCLLESTLAANLDRPEEQRIAVIMLSAAPPLPLLSSLPGTDAPDAEAGGGDALAELETATAEDPCALRWARVLAGFDVVAPQPPSLAAAPNPVSPTEPSAPEALRALEIERAVWPELDRIHDTVAAEVDQIPLFGAAAVGGSGAGALSPDQVAMRVAELADSHYRRQWMTCSVDERLVLIQLAAGRIVNAKDPVLLRGLITRGLVRRAPDLQLASASFAWFVRSAESRATVDAWEAGANESAWTSIRMPVFTLVAASAVIVLIAGGEATQSAMALLSAIAATVPALIERVGARGSLGRALGASQ